MGMASSRTLLPSSFNGFLQMYSGFVFQSPEWASGVGKEKKRLLAA